MADCDLSYMEEPEGPAGPLYGKLDYNKRGPVASFQGANAAELQAQQVTLGQQQNQTTDSGCFHTLISTQEMVKRLNRNQAGIEATLINQHKSVMLTPPQ